MTDARSPLAVKILNANPRAYEALVVEGETPALARELLNGVKPADLVAGAGQGKPDAMLAGLWLWHDGLEECHRIAQSMENVTGSFWHAIMHRREGDFGNSKYWYARAAGHPALGAMAAHAADLVHSLPAEKELLRVVIRGFDPVAFVDLVEKAAQAEERPLRLAAVALQQTEWRVLFDFCAR